MLFDTVTLTGQRGALSWGYLTPASCGRWAAQRDREGTWRLTAALETVDRFVLGRALKDRRFPVLFTATRRRGRWCWPVRTMTVGAASVAATLGPLEY